MEILITVIICIFLFLFLKKPTKKVSTVDLILSRNRHISFSQKSLKISTFNHDSESNKNISLPDDRNEESDVNYIKADFLPKEKRYLNKKNNSNLKDDNNIVINNYFIKNELHIHNTTQTSSDKECKDHTEKIWKELGYCIKSGETCSYKLYGREVFTPEQVVKKGVHAYYPELPGTGRTKNQKKVKALGFSLVKKYGSKRKAKIILIEEYDFDEDTAKYATGYQGYDDY